MWLFLLGNARFCFFFCLFYICLYFLISNLNCLIAHVNGNSGFCLGKVGICRLITFIWFLVLNFKFSFFICRLFLFTLIWSLLSIFGFLFLSFKSSLFLFESFLLCFQKSFIKEIIFLLVNDIWLGQTWLIFEFWASLESVSKFHVFLNVVLFELLKGHLKRRGSFAINRWP